MGITPPEEPVETPNFRLPSGAILHPEMVRFIRDRVALHRDVMHIPTDFHGYWQREIGADDVAAVITDNMTPTTQPWQGGLILCDAPPGNLGGFLVPTGVFHDIIRLHVAPERNSWRFIIRYIANRHDTTIGDELIAAVVHTQETMSFGEQLRTIEASNRERGIREYYRRPNPQRLDEAAIDAIVRTWVNRGVNDLAIETAIRSYYRRPHLAGLEDVVIEEAIRRSNAGVITSAMLRHDDDIVAAVRTWTNRGLDDAAVEEAVLINSGQHVGRAPGEPPRHTGHRANSLPWVAVTPREGRHRTSFAGTPPPLYSPARSGGHPQQVRDEVLGPHAVSGRPEVVPMYSPRWSPYTPPPEYCHPGMEDDVVTSDEQRSPDTDTPYFSFSESDSGWPVGFGAIFNDAQVLGRRNALADVGNELAREPNWPGALTGEGRNRPNRRRERRGEQVPGSAGSAGTHAPPATRSSSTGHPPVTPTRMTNEPGPHYSLARPQFNTRATEERHTASESHPLRHGQSAESPNSNPGSVNIGGPARNSLSPSTRTSRVLLPEARSHTARNPVYVAAPPAGCIRSQSAFDNNGHESERDNGDSNAEISPLALNQPRVVHPMRLMQRAEELQQVAQRESWELEATRRITRPPRSTRSRRNGRDGNTGRGYVVHQPVHRESHHRLRNRNDTQNNVRSPTSISDPRRRQGVTYQRPPMYLIVQNHMRDMFHAIYSSEMPTAEIVDTLESLSWDVMWNRGIAIPRNYQPQAEQSPTLSRRRIIEQGLGPVYAGIINARMGEVPDENLAIFLQDIASEIFRRLGLEEGESDDEETVYSEGGDGTLWHMVEPYVRANMIHARPEERVREPVWTREDEFRPLYCAIDEAQMSDRVIDRVLECATQRIIEQLGLPLPTAPTSPTISVGNLTRAEVIARGLLPIMHAIEEYPLQDLENMERLGRDVATALMEGLGLAEVGERPYEYVRRAEDEVGEMLEAGDMVNLSRVPADNVGRSDEGSEQSVSPTVSPASLRRLRLLQGLTPLIQEVEESDMSTRQIDELLDDIISLAMEPDAGAQVAHAPEAEAQNRPQFAGEPQIPSLEVDEDEGRPESATLPNA